jgi:hypothetical protein
MDESILVVVHLGAAGVIKYFHPDYGDYELYLSRVKDAICSRESIILTYMMIKDRTPFELPETAKIVESEDLVSELKRRNVARIDVCGEYLWWYEYDWPKYGCAKAVFDDLSEEFKKVGEVNLIRELCYPLNVNEKLEIQLKTRSSKN